MAVFAAVAIVSALAGGAAQVEAGNARKRAARRAAEGARKQRQWYEEQARQTRNMLQREIDSVKLLRSLDLPAYRQAQQIALIQKRKGMERVTRNRAVGGLNEDVRRAVFGEQFPHYIAREAQRIEHYSKLTQDIFQMAAEQQRQVNALLSQGGEAYSRGMSTAMQMDAEAGSSRAQVLGALAQAGSLYAKAGMAQQRQDERMEKTHAYNMELMREKRYGEGYIDVS